MKREWRRILERRSMLDKIGIARDCELCPVNDLPIVAELVREGILVWIDRAVLRHLLKVSGNVTTIGVETDVYQLTLKGIRLCDAEGIKRR